MISELRKNLISLLKNKTENIYGHDTKEGFERPSFFVELRQNGIPKITKNCAEYKYTATITYMQDELDSDDNYKMIDYINSAIGQRIGNAIVEDISFAYVGEDADILQATIDLSECEWKEIEEKTKMENLNLNKEV